MKLKPPELAVWQLRMLVDTGFANPADVPMPDLPATASVRACRVYQGFKLLLECKWLHSPSAPTTFACRFARAWCGASEWDARKGIKELIECGALRIVGKHIAGQLSMNLYLPG